jgi:hypothetical protein
MQKLAQVAHREKYCEDTRRGKLLNATNEKHWGQCNGGRIADGGTPYDRSRQMYHWLMTKHALVKKGIIEDTRGNADCVCGKVETHNGMFSRSSSSSSVLREVQSIDKFKFKLLY